MSEPIPDFVVSDLAQLEIECASQQLDQMAAYLNFLLESNKTTNLTGIRDHDQAWKRLIVDSLTVLPGLSPCGPGSSVVDVGSGGGLPGIPLAICRSDLSVALLESTGKKATFLVECVKLLALPNVTVVNDRAESIGHQRRHRQHYQVAVCRAVGPMRELLEYTLPLVAVDGWVLAMKGPSVEAELESSSDALMTLGGGEVHVYDAYPESFDVNTVIVRVDKDRPTPRDYPRRPGVPRQDPL